MAAKGGQSLAGGKSLLFVCLLSKKNSIHTPIHPSVRLSCSLEEQVYTGSLLASVQFKQ